MVTRSALSCQCYPSWFWLSALRTSGNSKSPHRRLPQGTASHRRNKHGHPQNATALARNGSPKPLLKTDEDRLYFLVTLYARSLDAAHMPTTSEKARIAAERRERLLSFFSEHPTSTMVDASIFLGVARSTISRDVAELRTSGRLAHPCRARMSRRLDGLRRHPGLLRMGWPLLRAGLPTAHRRYKADARSVRRADNRFGLEEQVR